jgi:hypothetical protein
MVSVVGSCYVEPPLWRQALVVVVVICGALAVKRWDRR